MKLPQSKSVLFWTPRVLAVLLCIFTAVLSFDVFTEDYGFWETFWALLMHLIPTYILTTITLVAWEKETIGGIIFIILGIIYILMVWNRERLIGSLVLSGPLLLTGGLFILNNYLQKVNKNNPKN